MDAPYDSGDEIMIGRRAAVVSYTTLADALDPGRRWLLLCRWADSGEPVARPLYCGDDGVGEVVAPLVGA